MSALHIEGTVSGRLKPRIWVLLMHSFSHQNLSQRTSDVRGEIPVERHYFLPPEVSPLRNSTTSPSAITYSLPSMRTLPAARAAAIEPASMSSP